VRRMTSVASLAAGSALLLGTLVGVPASTAAGHGLAAATVGSAGLARLDKPKKNPEKPPEVYNVPTGSRVNNPLGDREARRRIIGHLLHTINSTPGGEKIRFATWNMRSDDLTHALIMAHRRGVSVRVVIDRLNANPRNPNPGFERLTNALKFGQKKRPQNMKSFTRRCVSACRAPGGIAHVKFYLFSKVRKTKTKSARDIVMYGSANATDLAAYGQWNDLYTMRGQGSVYREFSRVFKQMTQDRNVDQPFLDFRHGNTTLDFYPYKGAGTKKDPLMEVLNDIVCKGATDGTGTKGHTRLRIAQTSMWGDRGIMIARRLRVMWQRGCDIKIVYAVLGNNVLWVLRHTTRGKVPIKQIAQDFNRDGVYDRYLHMKNMGVSGVYAGATNVNVSWNGSANWTSVALASDEVVGRIYSTKLMRDYSNWVDFLYAHPPIFSHLPPGCATCGGGGDPGGRTLAVDPDNVLALARARGVDPYAKMRSELGIPASVQLPH
jgi:phosphatidylserine/phosphatidylglycerophosphate/cardiolipin synthase-like enzyme